MPGSQGPGTRSSTVHGVSAPGDVSGVAEVTVMAETVALRGAGRGRPCSSGTAGIDFAGR